MPHAATTLLVGTTKGLFLLETDDKRTEWSVHGPLCDGWSINHAIGSGDALWAAGGGEFHGAGVWRSDDGGRNWTLAKLSDGSMDEWIRNDPDTAAFFGATPQPPAHFTGEIDALWSLGQVGDKLFAGAKPANLYVSADSGETWERLSSLAEYPERESWNPGAAGLTLHTIVASPEDPEKLWIGISAAGVFASEDGGQNWERRNRLSNAEACGTHHHPAAPRDGQTGHCVHNMVRGSAAGDLLYQQNHHGVFRSRDGGRNWDDITEGLPSTFGFPIAVHPGKPETVWTVPLNGDSAGRYPPDAKAAVWRSRDGGETWQDCRTGLPQESCFFTVLRQSMTTDGQESPGVYFGTNTGSVFASLDEGDSWAEIARHLPCVLCVEALKPEARA